MQKKNVLQSDSESISPRKVLGESDIGGKDLLRNDILGGFRFCHGSSRERRQGEYCGSTVVGVAVKCFERLTMETGSDVVSLLWFSVG